MIVIAKCILLLLRIISSLEQNFFKTTEEEVENVFDNRVKDQV